jgi:uncharacterized YccA/Bax inhibitor family protein
MRFVGVLATWIATTVTLVAWRAFVLVKLWAWFVVTTFGAAPITKAQAYGLVLVLSVAHQQKLPEAKKDQTFAVTISLALLEGLGVPAIALLFGSIIRGWL